MTDFERIRDDSRTWESIDSLFGHFLFGEDCSFELLQALAYLPKAWKSYQIEQPEKRQVRRDLLANSMLALARQIEDDPEAQYLTILDHNKYSSQLFSNRPTLANCLRDIAKDFKNKSSFHDLYNEILLEKNTTYKKQRKTITSMEQHEFVIRQVVWIIDVLLKNPSSFPNTVTATLVNVVLEITDFSSKTITAEQIKNRVKYMRENTQLVEEGSDLK